MKTRVLLASFTAIVMVGILYCFSDSEAQVSIPELRRFSPRRRVFGSPSHPMIVGKGIAYALLLLIAVLGIALASCREKDASEPHRVGLSDTTSFAAYASVPIEKPEPQWLEYMNRFDIEGELKLSLLVDESGRVVDVKVTQALYPMMDTLAIKAVAKWRFEPGRVADSHGNYHLAKFWVPVSFPWFLR